MVNKMKDRLKQLLRDANITWETAKIADRLIENGVVCISCECKDCICYEPYNKPVKDFDGYCVARGCETDETDFCNYGEKKEGINNG